MFKVNYCIVFLALLCSATSVFGRGLYASETADSIIKFQSAINNQNYELHVSLPSAYADNTKSYPVLYVLDGQWSLPYMPGINGGLNYDGLIPELIVVGITWPDNYEANRTRDFSPTPTAEFPGSGGAVAFLQVLKEEIVARINKEYRTEANKACLLGGSFSGLFTLFALLEEPTLFNGYLAGSPNVAYDKNFLFTLEAKFAAAKKDLSAKVFISSGEYEDQTGYAQDITRFFNQMKSRNYKNLQIERITVEKMGHASEGPYAHSRGLQFVYGPVEIHLDQVSLDQYTGKYKIGDAELLIKRKGSYLYVVDGVAEIKLTAVEGGRFYAKGLPGSAEFIKDEKGKVIEYVISIGADKLVAKKVK